MEQRYFNRIIMVKEHDNYSLDALANMLSSKDQILDFNKVKKSPEHQNGVFWNGTNFTDADKIKYGNNNIYDWMKDNCGTGSNCINPNKFIVGNKLIYTFETLTYHSCKIAQIISKYLSNYSVFLDFYNQNEFGKNCGTCLYKNDTIIDYNIFGNNMNKGIRYTPDSKKFNNSLEYLKYTWGKQLLEKYLKNSFDFS